MIQKFNEDLSAIEKSMIKKGTFCNKFTFSPFDVCEQVNQLEVQTRNHTLRTFVFNPLVHICQEKKTFD